MIRFALACERCQHLLEDGAIFSSIEDARWFAEQNGWTVCKSKTKDPDLCPNCQEDNT